MNARRNYYEVLGVSRSAKPEEIRQAHRRLAGQYWPGVNSHPDAEQRFKEVNDAYEVLSDFQKRVQYDIELLNSASSTEEDTSDPARSGSRPATRVSPSGNATPMDVDGKAREEIEALRLQAQQAKAQMAEYLDRWQRERDDFLKYRRRQEREQATLVQSVRVDLLKRLLPVVDDFERASMALPKQQEDQVAWLEGVLLIQRKLQAFLTAEGLLEVEVLGQPFDPNLHEAAGEVEATEELPAGHVVEVLRKGYRVEDLIVRPALVRVSR